jgi:hypothetical protein
MYQHSSHQHIQMREHLNCVIHNERLVWCEYRTTWSARSSWMVTVIRRRHPALVMPTMSRSRRGPTTASTLPAPPTPAGLAPTALWHQLTAIRSRPWLWTEPISTVTWVCLCSIYYVARLLTSIKPECQDLLFLIISFLELLEMTRAQCLRRGEFFAQNYMTVIKFMLGLM